MLSCYIRIHLIDLDSEKCKVFHGVEMRKAVKKVFFSSLGEAELVKALIFYAINIRNSKV